MLQAIFLPILGDAEFQIRSLMFRASAHHAVMHRFICGTSGGLETLSPGMDLAAVYRILENLVSEKEEIVGKGRDQSESR